MNGLILEKAIFGDTKTIALMDEFEKCDEKSRKFYEALKLNDVFRVKSEDGTRYWISLYIQRKSKAGECIGSNLTFSKFKKHLLGGLFSEANRNSYYIVDEVLNGIKAIGKGSHEKYTFPRPIQFNAQNSSNRSGYGNIYYGEDLVYEGTLYGETTNYMFVSAEYRR